ncbi:ribosome-associated protein L7Ae-like protein [Clostridium tepidiprofundi DSM 19306]|uniref:Ribosome-associated protein L7Ae-like protein n=1 Tax=Clostridium tepidiprofundi DSM 19306 TaxID=1121338 RepID=A0A151AUI0_9CLOT|nr:ribosomal L7Ae/L30e/S12e/Gadd45 family protein [Clostridium tepidiprofundi]KYH31298.1 ribosome-associated protein L7Ae-like protein [Clostridium tepidiprofundi DSM 19306]
MPEGDNQRVVGIKQTLKALKKYECKVVYIAKEADKHLVQPIIDLAESKAIEIVYMDTMKELGEFCRIDVGAAAALELK